MEQLDIKVGMKCLDIGCGGGYSTALMSVLCGPTVRMSIESISLSRFFPPAFTYVYCLCRDVFPLLVCARRMSVSSELNSFTHTHTHMHSHMHCYLYLSANTISSFPLKCSRCLWLCYACILFLILRPLCDREWLPELMSSQRWLNSHSLFVFLARRRTIQAPCSNRY